jgi:hypothetical protein
VRPYLDLDTVLALRCPIISISGPGIITNIKASVSYISKDTLNVDYFELWGSTIYVRSPFNFNKWEAYRALGSDRIFHLTKWQINSIVSAAIRQAKDAPDSEWNYF